MNQKRFSLPRIPRHVIAIFVAVIVVAPVKTLSDEDPFNGIEPFEQEFLITAYYSPIPGQCCYVKGGLKADKILNGEGLIAADGTGVYPGMIAAPPSYKFGTHIALPGLGMFEVHDRGGAILEREDGVHRLDIWVGHGEEGLARALTFGLQSFTGTVYPTGGPQPQTSFLFDSLPLFFARLNPYKPSDGNFLSVRPKLGDRGLSVMMLQEHLKAAGYFDHSETDLFGPETQRSLAGFIRDYQLDEPEDELTEKTAAYLLAASYRSDARDPVGGYVDKSSAPSVVTEAQRILRFLGYYKGRTDGEYSDELASTILKFQQDNKLVGTINDPGAGRIGPITTKALELAWNRKLVAKRAERLFDLKRIEDMLVDRGEIIERYLGEGEGWSEVRQLQQILADKGYFPSDLISGYFGGQTREAVLSYQMSHGLISGPDDVAAGFVGPMTLEQMNKERVREYYSLMRAEGWGAL
ncbi:peptidoglycan-binding protein [Patescibacteria group bacterium]|nr:peptidoglycan-binding protein [Patescibacteria group bacterium]